MSGGALELETEAGVLSYARELMTSLSKEFVESGDVEVGFVCLATWHDGKRLPHVTPTAIVFDDVPKGPMTAVVKTLAREMRATGVFSFGESWTVDFKGDAERFAWRNRNWGDHPRAREFVHVLLEHRTLGPRVWQAFITRDDAGKGTLAAFNELPRLLRLKGRFAEFLDFPLDQA